ncbi:hypothetical protein BH09PSE4_BH09PSE4_12020 [soil metagenome]
MRTITRQIGWLVVIWAGSVAGLGIVAYAIRAVLKP